MKLYAVRKKSGGWRKWSEPARTPILADKHSGALQEAWMYDTVVPVEVTIVEIKPKPEPKPKLKPKLKVKPKRKAKTKA